MSVQIIGLEKIAKQVNMVKDTRETLSDRSIRKLNSNSMNWQPDYKVSGNLNNSPSHLKYKLRAYSTTNVKRKLATIASIATQEMKRKCIIEYRLYVLE